MKLDVALDGYFLSMTASGHSQNTINLYRVYLQRLVEFLNNPDLSEIDSGDIQMFYAYMQTGYRPRRKNHSAEPLSQSSINKIWVAIRSFYTWVQKDLGLPRKDEKIVYLGDVDSDINPFTEDEIRKLLSACEKTLCKGSKHQPEHYQRRRTRTRDYAIIMFLLDTGLRVSELCRLRIDDVNLETGEVTVLRWGSGKKTRGRTVFIEHKTRQAVWVYLAKRSQKLLRDHLFCTVDGKAMTRNSVRCLLEDMANRAGISKANPHKFRHTFATQYLRNGGDVFTLQRLLGHTSLDMVKKYLTIANVDTANAHKRASPVENWHI